MDPAYDHQYLNSRLARVFQRRPILPRHGLLYRLCEVGPKRYDPRTLTTALQTSAAGSGAFTEPAVGLYADPALRKDQRQAATTAVLQVVEKIAILPWMKLVDDLTKAVIRTAEGAAEPDEITTETVVLKIGSPTQRTPLAGEFEVPREDKTIRVRTAEHAPVFLWITHEIPALDCEDSRLWQHIQRANEENASLIIVARAVTVPVFALCKAMGVYASQYYSMLLPQNTQDQELVQLGAIGWIPGLRINDLEEHPIQEHLQSLLWRVRAEHNLSYQQSRRSRAVNDAVARGFVSHDPSPTELLAWASTAALDLPEAWGRTMEARAAAGRTHVQRARARRRTHGRGPGDADRSEQKPSPERSSTEGAEATGDSQPASHAFEENPGLRVPADVDREQWDTLTRRADSPVKRTIATETQEPTSEAPEV